MSDYKPETVAAVTFQTDDMLNPNTQRGIRWQRGWSVVYDDGQWELIHDRAVSDVRPLVVLDLSRVGNTLDDANGIAQALIFTGIPVAVDIANMILEQTKPPKPAEPTGLGAVVEDSKGREWLRVDWMHPWCLAKPQKRDAERLLHGTHVTWDRLDAVKVLSEGVQP